MKRTKLVASMLACVMCLSVLTVGVWAAVNVGFGFDSQLTFNPEGVYVDISAQVYRGANYGTLAPLSGEGYSYTGNNYDLVNSQPSGNFEMAWENIPSLTLVPGNRAVKYRIEIRNASEESISGTATSTITGTTGTANSSTSGGVITTTYDNLTTTEYAQYIKNIQPNYTQVYEYIVELKEGASSATINVSIDFNFVESSYYTLNWTSMGDNLSANFVNIGSYPQRYVGNVMNSELEDNLNNSNLIETGKIYTTYDGVELPTSVDANNATPNLINNKEYEYIDGNKYVRVETPVFNSTSGTTYMNGETVTSGQVAWFKVEPIMWRILTENYNSIGTAMLLSEVALTANTSFYPTIDDSYEDLTNYTKTDNPLRNFVTKYFYNDAFLNSEKANIVGRDFAAGEFEDYPDWQSSALTDEKVWIPTASDYQNTNYGFSTEDTFSIRICSPSDFAIANNAYFSNVNIVSSAVRDNGGTTVVFTSTGDAFYDTSALPYLYVVDIDGWLQASYMPNNFAVAIRPAMLYNL